MSFKMQIKLQFTKTEPSPSTHWMGLVRLTSSFFNIGIAEGIHPPRPSLFFIYSIIRKTLYYIYYIYMYMYIHVYKCTNDTIKFLLLSWHNK